VSGGENALAVGGRWLGANWGGKYARWGVPGGKTNNGCPRGTTEGGAGSPTAPRELCAECGKAAADIKDAEGVSCETNGGTAFGTKGAAASAGKGAVSTDDTFHV